MTCSHLWCDDLYGRHEAVCNDGHPQEHVHERDKVDHSSCHLVAEPGLVGLPDREEDAASTHRHLQAFVFLNGRIAFAISRRRREGGGEHGGWGRPQVWGAAGLAALGLGLAGRQREQEEEEEEEDGRRRGWQRHGCVRFPQNVEEKGSSEKRTLKWESGVGGALGRAESGVTSPPGGENRQNIKEKISLRRSGGTSKSLNVLLFYPNCKTLSTFYGRSKDLKGRTQSKLHQIRWAKAQKYTETPAVSVHISSRST